MGRFIKGIIAVSVLSAVLAACAPVDPTRSSAPGAATPSRPETARPERIAPRPPPPEISARMAARNFVGAVSRMEPVIERECVARRSRPINCDFHFVVDDRTNQPPNAFQTEDAQGRPVIGFTIALIARTRNQDEIAFVLGHEAAHHILNHIAQKTSSATLGANILGGLAAASGADSSTVRAISDFGAGIGARASSKSWELQADYLGTILTRNAGFNPRKGAQLFYRMPDAGERILGTHPSRRARLAQVENALDDLATGRAR